MLPTSARLPPARSRASGQRPPAHFRYSVAAAGTLTAAASAIAGAAPRRFGSGLPQRRSPLLRRRYDPRPPLGGEAALLPGGFRWRWRRRRGSLGYGRLEASQIRHPPMEF